MSGEPFGKPFKYTDSYDLPGNFANPGQPTVPWYKRLFRRKRPIAWAVIEAGVPVAYICPPQEPRHSLVDPKVFSPIYDEAVILAAAEAEAERGEPDV